MLKKTIQPNNDLLTSTESEESNVSKESNISKKFVIKINDVKVKDLNLTLDLKEQIIKCGKRKFLKIVK